MDRPPKLVQSKSEPVVTDNKRIECWVYGDLPSNDAKSRFGDILDEDIVDWFREPGPQSEHPWKNPTAGLRLICRKQDVSTAQPFNEITLNAIHNALGIPASHTYLTKHDAGVCGKLINLSQQPIFCYHRSNNNSTVSTVLRYDPETCTTIGYILLGPDIEISTVKNAIETQFASFSHPLMIPILLAEITATDLMRKMHEVHAKLADIEHQTGFGDWGEKATMDTASQDYRGIARDVGALDCKLAFLEVAIQCTIMGTEFSVMEINAMKNYIPASKLRQLKTVTANLNNRADILFSNLRHMQMFAGIRERMRAQQNVIFNLIAQQDNLLNIEVARDSKELAAASKRDSSAMKIIAFLTTLFLPGTFISTFFAMPLFKWDAASMAQVTTNHFWVYWAITIPLTCLVMGLVTAYAYRQARKKELDREDARKSAGKSMA